MPARFVDVWAALITTIAADPQCLMTCDEADALADLMYVAGRADAADDMLAEHAALDEPGSGHQSNW